MRYVTPPHPGVHGASVSFESLELLSVGLESPQALWSPTAFKPLGPSPVSSLDTRSSRSPRASGNSGGLASPDNQGPVEALGDVAWTLGRPENPGTAESPGSGPRSSGAVVAPGAPMSPGNFGAPREFGVPGISVTLGLLEPLEG